MAKERIFLSVAKSGKTSWKMNKNDHNKLEHSRLVKERTELITILINKKAKKKIMLVFVLLN